MFIGDGDLLSEKIEVEKVEKIINLPIKLADIKKVVIDRNDSYDIRVKIIGESSEKYCYDRKEKAGRIQEKGTLVCSVFNEKDLILDHCYFDGYTERYRTSEKKYEIEYYIKAYAVIVHQQTQSEVEICRECFVNSVKNPFIFMGLQEREKESILNGNINDDIRELMVSRTEEYNSKIHVKYGSNAFDIVNIEKDKTPEWCNKIAIEYKREYGYIPNEEERIRISNFVSFILGKQLLCIGRYECDAQMTMLNGEFNNAKSFGYELKKLCTFPAKPPVEYGEYKNRYHFINTLESLLPKYLEQYETYQFVEIFDYYWYARMLSIEVNLPLAATVLERIMRSWYSSTGSKTKGVLIAKREFEKLTTKLIEEIELKLGEYQYKDNIVNRINGCYNMGVRERFDIFFEEIQLSVGEMERKAMKARNIMSHGGKTREQEDVQNDILVNEAYFVLINRVIMKILKYKGDYIDYSTIGYPIRNIDEVAGTTEKKDSIK